MAIAKAAGYSDGDALLLAWADEETDYTLQVQWYNCAWSNLGLYFHFLPGDPKELICRVDSELTRRIMLSTDFGSLPRTMSRIIALGIALHGLQDTYFHQSWVGKFSRHNCLPAWSQNKFTPSLPFPYGHSPMGKIPDDAIANWYDPRTNKQIMNISRVYSALDMTAKILGLAEAPVSVKSIFYKETDYDTRKQKLRDLAGMPNLRFSEIRKDMLKKYGKEFKEAAKAQIKIIKEYLNGK